MKWGGKLRLGSNPDHLGGEVEVRLKPKTEAQTSEAG
jgi:hypothetical protein